MEMTAPLSAPASVGGRPRYAEVDYLRGLVMVVMAIDHVHYYFTSPALTPLNVENTSPGQFLTRWLSHFCAPIFVFLAGTGAFLRGTRGASKADSSRFLITRGLWLVFLELVVVRWDWTFTADVGHSSGQVLWVIGWSMILLAGLIRLPIWALAGFSAALIVGHNSLDGIDPNTLGVWRPVWLLLHGQGLIEIAPGVTFNVYYPIIPWVGVMTAGYVFGTQLTLPAPERRRRLVIIGIVSVVSFVALRVANVYGDPRPWQVQRDDLFTMLSFLNCEKYPPSLLFLLVTLGPGILLLACPSSRWGLFGRVCGVYGRAPLLYYLLHIAIIHASALAFAELRYGDSSFLIGNEWLIAPEHYPPDWGYDLWVVYAVWAAVVIALYPVCSWFGRLKQRKKHWWWLSYL